MCSLNPFEPAYGLSRLLCVVCWVVYVSSSSPYRLGPRARRTCFAPLHCSSYASAMSLLNNFLRAPVPFNQVRTTVVKAVHVCKKKFPQNMGGVAVE